MLRPDRHRPDTADRETKAGDRIVVAAHGDGTIRWYRADDGRELLALQELLNKGEPSKSNWVLWTPEGFYEATPGGWGRCWTT